MCKLSIKSIVFFRYIHPIDERECQVVIGGDYITTETGTGLVHTAPGHGQEDYATGLKYGLPIISPVDDDGKFTEEAGQFSGLDVLGDGNTAVVKYLDGQFSLILEESYGKALSLQKGEKMIILIPIRVLYNYLVSTCHLFIQNINIHMIGEQRNQQFLGQLSNGLHQWRDFARLLWMLLVK